MAGWWFEAYTLPHKQAGGLVKIAEQVPVQDWSFEENTDRARSTIKFAVPREHPFFDINDIFRVDPEVHSNDIGSIVVARNSEYVDGSNVPLPLQAYFVARRPDQTSNVQESIVDFSGRHLLTALDHFSVYPFDYPVDPSLITDWQYGAESILENPGFEDGSVQAEIWYLWIDGATTGTFQLRSGVEVTGNIAWDATGTDVKNAIETGFAWIISCSVSGQGTIDDPFFITINDPSDKNVFDLFVDINNTDGDVEAGVDRQGGGLDISGWTRSVAISTQSSEYGRYASDGFRLSVAGEPVRSGLYSLRVNGLEIYTGAMQRVQVVPGQRYRGSIWVFTASTTDVFRLVIRDIYDEFIASSHGLSGVSVPANTWTEFTVDFVVPDYTTDIVFRFAVVGVNGNPGEQGNPIPFYLDDASFSPGAPPSNMGVIWNDLMDDIQFDHEFDPRGSFALWINRTWDEANDSDGSPWTDEHSITIREGMTYLQFAEEVEDRFGYKFDMWLDPNDMEVYMGIFQDPGTDNSADDSISLVIGKDIISRELVKSEATATDVFARGAEGLFAEAGNSALRTAWDRRERFIRDPNLTAVSDLTLAAQEQLNKLMDAMLGMKFEMMDIEGGDTKPFVHFKTWDRINVEPGSDSGIGKAARSVEAIKVDGTGGDATSISLHLSSEVFGSSGFAAQAEAVRRLVRKFQFHLPHPQEGGGLAFPGGGGGIPDVVVAAEDTLYIDSADLRSQDFTSDEEMLQAAIALLDEDGGWIHLLAGTYIFSGPIFLAGKSVRLTGAEPGSTIIKVAAGVTVTGVIDFGVNPLGGITYTIEDLTIDGAGATVSAGLILAHGGGVAAEATRATIHLNRLVLKDSSSLGIRGQRSASAWHLRSVTVTGCGDDGIFIQESIVFGHVVRCTNNGGAGYRCAYSGPHLLTACEFTGNTGDGIGNGGLFGGAPEIILLGSVVAGNGGNGVDAAHVGIEDPGIFVGNRISGNGGRSILANPASVVMGNRISGNGTDTPIPDQGNMINGVWSSGSGGGVALDGTADAITFSTQPGVELTAGQGSFRFVAPRAGTLVGVTAAVGGPATGADVIVDVNLNGGTVFTTQANRPTVADGQGVGAEATPNTTAILAGDWFTVDIDQVGSTYSGADLTVTLHILWDLEESA